MTGVAYVPFCSCRLICLCLRSMQNPVGYGRFITDNLLLQCSLPAWMVTGFLQILPVWPVSALPLAFTGPDKLGAVMTRCLAQLLHTLVGRRGLLIRIRLSEVLQMKDSEHASTAGMHKSLTWLYSSTTSASAPC